MESQLFSFDRIHTRPTLGTPCSPYPVIFMEPYIMNSATDCPCLQVGAYQGLKKVNDKPQSSIFREYADSLAAGLSRYDSGQRASAQ